MWTISQDALRLNLRRVRQLAPKSKVMVPVKCNAYGHGIEEIVTSLTDCDAFAVASIDEAIQIRPLTDKPIIILEGLYHEDEFSLASQYRCEIIIHCLEQLEMLKNYRGTEKFHIWLKINTGMCRLGIEPDDFNHYWQSLSALSNIHHPIKLMTHFASADEQDNPSTAKQIELFQKTTAGLSVPRSLANSAGILGWPESHADWVRPGIMLYGISPIRGMTATDHDLQPVMSVTSNIIAIRHCKQGDRIGYGGTWICQEDMPIGIIAIGYGDGYPRSLPSGTPVYLNGKVATTIGNISMDMTAIDLRHHPEASIGTTVTLWGDQLPIEKIAEHANTVPYEIVCNIHQRLKRRIR